MGEAAEQNTYRLLPPAGKSVSMRGWILLDSVERGIVSIFCRPMGNWKNQSPERIENRKTSITDWTHWIVQGELAGFDRNCERTEVDVVPLSSVEPGQ